MWCPKCKNEYVEGITHCKQCDVDLVEDLKNIPTFPIASGDEEMASGLADFLKFNKLETAIVKYNSETTLHTVECAEYEMNIAEELKNTFESKRAQLAQFADESYNFNSESDTESELECTQKPAKSYVKKEDKYKETASSGYSLVIVGGLGLIALLLVITDIINLNLAAPGKYITYGGLGLLFGIFFVIGIKSLMSLKKLSKEAEEESKFTDEIFNWFEKNITNEMLDEGIDVNSVEELQYFKRFDNIKHLISKTFGELDESYLDKVAEDIYNKRFY